MGNLDIPMSGYIQTVLIFDPGYKVGESTAEEIKLSSTRGKILLEFTDGSNSYLHLFSRRHLEPNASFDVGRSMFDVQLLTLIL